MWSYFELLSGGRVDDALGMLKRVYPDTQEMARMQASMPAMREAFDNAELMRPWSAEAV